MTICITGLVDVDTIVITQGADETYEITVVDALGNPFDLTNAQGFFTVKKRWKDTLPVILKRTANAGGSNAEFLVLTQTGATKGKAQFFIAFSDIVSLTNDEVDNANHYVYDVWFVLASGKHKPVRTIRPFEIRPRVTVIP